MLQYNFGASNMNIVEKWTSLFLLTFNKTRILPSLIKPLSRLIPRKMIGTMTKCIKKICSVFANTFL